MQRPKRAAQKAAAEAEKAAAADRYKKLLDEVNSSLQSVDGGKHLVGRFRGCHEL